MGLRITLIAAMDRNRLIGSRHGGIPWHLPRDQAHFRSYTQAGVLMLGRRTYEEMRGWFTPLQRAIVVSQNASLATDDSRHKVVEDIAMGIAKATALGADELIVCGGAQLYSGTIPYADRLVLTQLDQSFEVTEPVYFPDIPSNEWHLSSSETWPTDALNPWPAECQTWERRKRPDHDSLQGASG